MDTFLEKINTQRVAVDQNRARWSTYVSSQMANSEPIVAIAILAKDTLWEMVLTDLDAFDNKLYADVKLKEGESLYRYNSNATIAGKIQPLIKVNIQSGLVYFMTEDGLENDTPIFETKGMPANIRVLESHILDLVKRKEDKLRQESIPETATGLYFTIKTADGSFDKQFSDMLSVEAYFGKSLREGNVSDDGVQHIEPSHHLAEKALREYREASALEPFNPSEMIMEMPLSEDDKAMLSHELQLSNRVALGDGRFVIRGEPNLHLAMSTFYGTMSSISSLSIFEDTVIYTDNATQTALIHDLRGEAKDISDIFSRPQVDVSGATLNYHSNINEDTGSHFIRVQGHCIGPKEFVVQAMYKSLFEPTGFYSYEPSSTDSLSFNGFGVSFDDVEKIRKEKPIAPILARAINRVYASLLSEDFNPSLANDTGARQRAMLLPGVSRDVSEGQTVIQAIENATGPDVMAAVRLYSDVSARLPRGMTQNDYDYFMFSEGLKGAVFEFLKETPASAINEQRLGEFFGVVSEFFPGDRDALKSSMTETFKASNMKVIADYLQKNPTAKDDMAKVADFMSAKSSELCAGLTVNNAPSVSQQERPSQSARLNVENRPSFRI